MNKIAILSAAGALLCAAPALADEPTTTTSPSAPSQCRTERTQMGKAVFAATYGTNKHRSNAFGKCVSARTKAMKAAEKQDEAAARAACTQEQAADPAAFAAKYGKGKKAKNAFGKCVSAASKAMAKEQGDKDVSDDVSASKSCKAERDADAAAFTKKYGTGKKGANAFGRCVSSTAKAKGDDAAEQEAAPQS